MASATEVYTDNFLRTYRNLFTAREMGKYLSQMGIHASNRETEEFLQTHPLVFPLEQNYYITRAGAFSDKFFSMKPTADEYANGMLVPGDRCIPFVDSEMISSSLEFYFKGNKLPKKVATFDSDTAIDMFQLYGEEYAPQYIAADPANEDLDLVENEFALPVDVKLTGVDISMLKENYGLKKDDRFLCRVFDWDKGRIEIKILSDSVEGDPFNKGCIGEARLHWYRMLENLLLGSFDRLGPCVTIEEQLADLFFEHRAELCVPECGSVEEYLQRYAKNVGIEFFGVETRLWHKGESVPGVGPWNKDLYEISRKTNKPCAKEAYGFDADVCARISDFIFDQYILDMLFRKSTDLEDVYNRIFPSEYEPSIMEKNEVQLHLKERNDILRDTYNWFADQTTGPVRQRALALYGKVSLLVYKIDCMGNSLDQFPQQELVILSQLFSNVTRILESVANNDQSIEEDAEALLMSLDGMEMNFEDIEDELEYAVFNQQSKKFTVIK